MGLLRGSWSEVFTLSIIFRSLPTTVAAASLAAREVSSGNKRKLKFAPDYAMTQNIANKCGLQAFYEQVIQLDSDETSQLLNKPYLNEVTLRGQKQSQNAASLLNF